MISNRIIPTLVCTLLCCPTFHTFADEITVKGTRLEGTVRSVDDSEIGFETIYGAGTIQIPLEDVEAITTEDRHYILYGDDEQAVGRLLGIEQGRLLVGEDPETATRVETSSIFESFPEETAEATIAGRLERRWRYWSGNFDAGFNFQRSTVDETGAALAARLERRKKPTRFVAETTYVYGITDPDDGEKTTSDNEVIGRLRGEWDLDTKPYLWATGYAEYDGVERVSFRGIPAAGPGYRFYEGERGLLQVDLGAAWVYERFFGGDDSDYPAVRLGGEGWTLLPIGAKLSSEAEFLQSVDDTTDYLIIGRVSLAVPIVSFFALKASLSNQYDNTPAEGTAHNELKTMLGLSYEF